MFPFSQYLNIIFKLSSGKHGHFDDSIEVFNSLLAVKAYNIVVGCRSRLGDQAIQRQDGIAETEHMKKALGSQAFNDHFPNENSRTLLLLSRKCRLALCLLQWLLLCKHTGHTVEYFVDNIQHIAMYVATTRTTTRLWHHDNNKRIEMNKEKFKRQQQ